MCGRFSLTASPEDLAEIFELDDIVGFPPRYNIAPTQPILVVSADLSGKKAATLVRWGFVPQWVKNPDEFTLLVNARSETAADKPSFRTAMRHRRVLIPASGFYEWHRPTDKTSPKQPYWIKPKTGDLTFFGGLMETWMGADGTEIDTGCILTTAANRGIESIHHRMPVVIEPKNFERWLNCSAQEPRDVVDLMQPISEEYFEAIAVSDRVNKVANSGPEIQEPGVVKSVAMNSEPEKPKPTDQLDLF